MCYTITVLCLLCGLPLFSAPNPDFPMCIEGHSIKWGPGNTVTDTPQLCALAAEQVQTAAPDKKQSRPEKNNGKPARVQQDEKSPRQPDKKPPLKDFQPSEKIDADKAVDFPADI